MKEGKIVAFSGGTGGAKLTHGLSAVCTPKELLIVANVGDDFRYYGLNISPDIDSILYMHAGLINNLSGWGRNDETWNCFNELSQMGEDVWFQLGDRDLAVHLYRTHRLTTNATLESVTLELCDRFGITPNIIPATNESISTMVETDIGHLPFQDYFVRHKCQPKVRSIYFAMNRGDVRPSTLLSESIEANNIKAIIICPSNPYLSIDPILSVPTIKEYLREVNIPRIVVSPVVNGASLKGPTSKIMNELNVPVNTISIADHYKGVVNAIVIDSKDLDQKDALEARGLHCLVTNITMSTFNDRKRLASDIMSFVNKLYCVTR